MTIEIINPLTCPDWDQLLLTNDKYSFFYSSEWARTICKTYDYKAIYFTSFENGNISKLFPVLEVNSRLTRKRAVALPFTDYCEPISENKEQFEDLLEFVSQYGKKAGWKYLEWRGGNDYVNGTPYHSVYLVHSVELDKEEKELIKSFRDSTGRGVRKAIREGVQVRIDNSMQAVKRFYRLHCVTRKYYGVPPQPYRFFENIQRYILSRGKGIVVLAFYGEREVAGAVFFHLGRRAIFKYAAFDRRYQGLRPNNLVMWEALKWFSQNGFQKMNLGRTELENSGLLQYKRGWGSETRIVNYYRYDLKRGNYVPESGRTEWLFHIFRKMPGPLLNLAGTLLYRHVG